MQALAAQHVHRAEPPRAEPHIHPTVFERLVAKPLEVLVGTVLLNLHDAAAPLAPEGHGQLSSPVALRIDEIDLQARTELEHVELHFELEGDGGTQDIDLSLREHPLVVEGAEPQVVASH